MKAILEFDLPQESEAHQTALDGQKWKDLVVEFERYLHDLENVDQNPPVEEIRNKLFSMANKNGVQIWE